MRPIIFGSVLLCLLLAGCDGMQDRLEIDPHTATLVHPQQYPLYHNQSLQLWMSNLQPHEWWMVSVTLNGHPEALSVYGIDRSVSPYLVINQDTPTISVGQLWEGGTLAVIITRVEIANNTHRFGPPHTLTVPVQP